MEGESSAHLLEQTSLAYEALPSSLQMLSGPALAPKGEHHNFQGTNFVRFVKVEQIKFW